MKKSRTPGVLFLVLAVLALVATATADNLYTYGDTTVVATPPSPPPPPESTVWQLTSDTNGIGYAGLELQITGALTPATLTNLSAEYLMTQGTFNGGAPRFTLFDSSLNSAWIYWGTPLGGGSFADPCGGTAWCNTGNYADQLSNDIRVYSNCFGGDCNPNTGVTWATFAGLVGNTNISWITLDLDAGWAGTQQMLVANMMVNDQTYNTPEPGTLVMMGSGVVSLASLLRRKLNFH